MINADNQNILLSHNIKIKYINQVNSPAYFNHFLIYFMTPVIVPSRPVKHVCYRQNASVDFFNVIYTFITKMR